MYPDFMDTQYWNKRRVEPRDCVIVKVSTPVFVWRQPFDADLSVAYTFELRNAAGSLVASKSTLTPRLFFAETPLAPGNYTWKVSYRNKSGATITSASRRFNVAAEAVGVTIPSADSIVELAMRKPHPRALPAGATFPEIAAAALGGEYNAAFSAYMNAAAKYRVEAPPAPPADLTRANFANEGAYLQWMIGLATPARKERAAIEVLGYATRFSGDTSYASAGVARLVSLAAWPTRGATSEEVNDLANSDIYATLALGLDLYADFLSPTQTSNIVSALRDRLGQAIETLSSLNERPYQSHPVDTIKQQLVALLYSVGFADFPESREWLRQAWETWMTIGTTWGADGGFADSTAYSWYAGISMAEAAATVRLITNTDISHLPVVSQFGSNMIALVAPSNNLTMPFGDSSEGTTLYAANSPNALRLYAAVTRNPVHEWYWRSTPTNINKWTPLSALHYLLLGLKPSPVSPVAPVANSWVFEDEGQVAIHSRTADPNRSSLFFRSSRFGSVTHHSADNNGFVFVSNGKAIFISGGYYPYYGSPHHSLVGRATRFKNALTFDGGIGQAELGAAPASPGAPQKLMDARGQLVNFSDNGSWAVATGDATLAYRGYEPRTNKFTSFLSNAVRTVAYNRSEKIAVIYDWATSDTPRTWELNFQMMNAPILNAGTLRAVNGDSKGCVDVYNAPGEFKVTKGFPVVPENGLPDQYQARYSVSRASTALVAVTVIREDCKIVPVNVAITGTSASVAINGAAALVMDRRTVGVP